MTKFELPLRDAHVVRAIVAGSQEPDPLQDELSVSAVREACVSDLPLARAWVAYLRIALLIEGRVDEGDALAKLANESVIPEPKIE